MTAGGRPEALHGLAREHRAEALLDLGRPTEAIPDLTVHTDAHPRGRGRSLSAAPPSG